MKREESQGRKSNSIDYQPNHCLHHNVTFVFSWLHVGYQRFFCVSRYSVIRIFRFWNTWLGYQWLPRWGSGLLLQLIVSALHFTLSWIPVLVGNKSPVKIISNWFVIFFSCLYSLYVTMIMVVCEKRKNEKTNLISFKFFYVYAHVYAIIKVGSFSEENGKKRWCGPAKIKIKNT